MKTLYLMRHAKSSWKDEHLADHERPLKKRGRKDAAAMGELLGGRKQKPEVILCSSADRARETADIVAEKGKFKGKVEQLKKLYLAEPDAIIAALQHVPDEVKVVLLVGHNPGLEALAQVLGGKIVALPTAAVAHLKLPVEKWSAIDLKTRGKLAHLWLPKEPKEPKKPKEPKQPKKAKQPKDK